MIPTLDAAEALPGALAALAGSPLVSEVIVSDGGSMSGSSLFVGAGVLVTDQFFAGDGVLVTDNVLGADSVTQAMSATLGGDVAAFAGPF